MNLITSDSAPVKGIRTTLQAFVAFIFGLAVTIWTTPGVPERVQAYVQPYEAQILLTLGISTTVGAGFFAYIFNYLRDRKPVVPEEPPTIPVAETGTPTQ